jgi:hypothetical protein
LIINLIEHTLLRGCGSDNYIEKCQKVPPDKKQYTLTGAHFNICIYGFTGMGNIPNGSALPAPRLVELFNSIIGTGKMDDGLRELGGVLFLASEYPHTGQKLRTGYWEATSGSKQGCVLRGECPRSCFLR